MHEVLTERRDESVDLGELLERLRAMLVQGLGGGKDVEARSMSVSLEGDRATALALVFSELLQNALEHGGERGADRAAPAERRRLLAIADDGAGIAGAPRGRASRSSRRSSATSSAGRCCWRTKAGSAPRSSSRREER